MVAQPDKPKRWGPPRYLLNSRAKKLIHFCGGDPRNPFHRGHGCSQPIERGELIMRLYWWHKFGRGERSYHLDCWVEEFKQWGKYAPDLPTIPRGRSTGRPSLGLTKEQANKRRSLLTQAYTVRKKTKDLTRVIMSGALTSDYADYRRRELGMKYQSIVDQLKDLGGKPVGRNWP